jgi:predicted MPP superfamily phosphohydrolase
VRIGVDFQTFANDSAALDVTVETEWAVMDACADDVHARREIATKTERLRRAEQSIFMGMRFRFAAWLAIAVLALLVATDSVLVPIHERDGGELTSRLIGIGRLLGLPGLMVAETFGARFQHRAGWIKWVGMLASSVPIYLALGLCLRGLWGSRKVLATPGSAVDDDQPAEVTHVEPVAAAPGTAGDAGDSVSRRGLFLMARRAAVVGVAGTAGYSYCYELRNVEVTRRSIGIRDLSAPLDGLRIVQLSDIHHGPWTSLNYVRDVVRQANALRPDLVVLTGDYVHQSDAYIEPVVREMAELRGRLGVVATLGNHDWWEDEARTLRAFARTSVRMLDNDRLFVTGDGTLETSVGRADAAHALCLAGVGDLWEGSPDYARALDGVPPGMPRVLLSHNPDVAEEPPLLRFAPRVDLMLSGHTHGGQVSLPGVGTLVTPSKYGNRYAAGLVQGPLGPVYVNRGIGTTIMPIRLGVRPEIAVIELRRA